MKTKTNLQTGMSALLLAAAVLLCCCGRAAADYRIEQWITITNTPTNGMTLVFNGTDTRTWATNVTNSATQIQVTNRIDYATTNLYAEVAVTRFSGTEVTWGTNTNQVVILLATNVVRTLAASAGWATITYRTNTIYGSTYLNVPFTAAQTATLRQWLMSELSLMFTNSTQAIPALTIALSNFLNTATNAQSAANKSFTGGNWSGGLSNAIAGGAGGTNQATRIYLTNIWPVVDSTGAFGLMNELGSKFTFRSVPTNTWDVIRLGSLLGLLPWFETNDFFSVSNNEDYNPPRMDIRVKVGAYLEQPQLHDPWLQGDLTMDGTLLVQDAATSVFVSADGTDWAYFNSEMEEFDQRSLTRYGAFNNKQFGYNTGKFLNSIALISGYTSTNRQAFGVETNSGARIDKSVTISSLTAGNNVWSRTNYTNALIKFAISSDAIIAGIAGNFGDGDTFDFVNLGPASLSFTNDSGFTGTASDRVWLNGTNRILTIATNQMGRARYNGTVSKWMVGGLQ